MENSNQNLKKAYDHQMILHEKIEGNKKHINQTTYYFEPIERISNAKSERSKKESHEINYQTKQDKIKA